MNKDELMQNLIQNLHKCYRNDPWLNELFSSTVLTLDEIERELIFLYEQFWFDTVDEKFLPIYEKLLDIKTNPNSTIEDRRALIEAKWKSSGGKCDIKLIQAVCNSWKNGKVTASFINGTIQLKFNGESGVPKNLDTLIFAVDDVKPTHLPLKYIFVYLLIKDIHNKMKIKDLQTKKIMEFAFNPR